MRLSAHFTLEELIFSQTATRLGIDNTPTPEVIANLRRLAQTLLEPVRQMIGVPLIVTSGYRSLLLNDKIGGAANSYHIRGCAADCVAPSFGTPYDLAERIVVAELPFDKLILEFGRWVHVQIPASEDETPRRIVLTAKREDGGIRYLPGLQQEVNHGSIRTGR